MSTNVNLIRILGAAQLVVFLLSAVNERLTTTVVGSASGSEILVIITNNLSNFRLRLGFGCLSKVLFDELVKPHD